jgi:hypothetical protein
MARFPLLLSRNFIHSFLIRSSVGETAASRDYRQEEQA